MHPPPFYLCPQSSCEHSGKGFRKETCKSSNADRSAQRSVYEKPFYPLEREAWTKRHSHSPFSSLGNSVLQLSVGKHMNENTVALNQLCKRMNRFGLQTDSICYVKCVPRAMFPHVHTVHNQRLSNHPPITRFAVVVSAGLARGQPVAAPCIDMEHTTACKTAACHEAQT